MKQHRTGALPPTHKREQIIDVARGRRNLAIAGRMNVMQTQTEVPILKRGTELWECPSRVEQADDEFWRTRFNQPRHMRKRTHQYCHRTSFFA
jgi:hypothetical protein